MPTNDSEENKYLTIGKSLGIPAASFIGGNASSRAFMTDYESDKRTGGNSTLVKQLIDRSGFPKDRVRDLGPGPDKVFYKDHLGDSKFKKDYVAFPKGVSPEVASHELGHATIREGGPFNKAREIANFSRILAAHPRANGLLGLALSGTGYIADSPELTYGGLAVTGIPQALQLGEEAIASIKGYNMLKRIGGNPRLSRYLLPYGTYLGAAGVAAGIPAYLSYKQYHRHDGENVKESSMNPTILEDAYNRGVKLAMEEIEKVAATRWMKELQQSDPMLAEKARAERASRNYNPKKTPMESLHPAHAMKVQQGQEFKTPTQKKKLNTDFSNWVNQQRGVGSPNSPTRPGGITQALQKQDGGIKNMLRRVPGLLAKHPVATALGAGALGFGLGGAMMGGGNQQQQQPQIVIER